MNNFSIAEKIEAVVHSGRNGALGDVIWKDRTMHVTTDCGTVAVVRCVPGGWSVSVGNFEAISERLLDAAHDAVTAR